ncbi:unnamed protein product [Musa hybrid cultivar]
MAQATPNRSHCDFARFPAVSCPSADLALVSSLSCPAREAKARRKDR